MSSWFLTITTSLA